MATKVAPPTLDDLLKELRITPTLLDQRCSNEHLNSFSLFLDWRRIAPFLGLSEMDIQEIETDKKTEAEKRLKTLQNWKRKFGYKAKFTLLVETLLDVGNAEDAEKVCRVLQPQVHTGDSSDSGAATASATPSDLPQSSPIAIAKHIPEHSELAPSDIDPEALVVGDLSPDDDEETYFGRSGSPTGALQYPQVASGLPSSSWTENCPTSRALVPENTDGSVSPRARLQSGEQQINEDASMKHGSTSRPYEDCCCRLKNGGAQGLQDAATGSGVIVKLTSTPGSATLMSCLPCLEQAESVEKYGSLQTSYVLITCHHIIPGMSHLKGWYLDLGLGKKHRLESIVCRVVSCCGEDGIISSGSNPTDDQQELFSAHQNSPDSCYINLDFSMLFLNEKFQEKKFLSKTAVIPELNLDIPKPNKQLPLQLYRRVGQKITVVPLVQQDSHTQSPLPDHEPWQLRDEIETHKLKEFHLIQYTPINDYMIEEGPSAAGSPVVYYDLVNKTAHLIGIHVGGAHDKGYYGVTTYEIFELLKGKPTAFFAIMERPLARRMWPVRWAHLLIHTLGGYAGAPKENRPPYSYLVEVVYLLLRELETVRLINLIVDDPSRSKVTAAFQVLAALFKCFEGSRYEELEAAISGDGGVFAGDEKAEREFKTDLRNFAKFLDAYLKYLENSTNVQPLVNTYLELYNNMLNFKEKDISALLCKDDMIDRLKGLRKKYESFEIERNFSDILIKKVSQLKKEMQEQHATQLALALKKRTQELQEQHASQLALALQKRTQELQEQHASQLQKRTQELQEQHESQLQGIQQKETNV